VLPQFALVANSFILTRRASLASASLVTMFRTADASLLPDRMIIGRRRFLSPARRSRSRTEPCRRYATSSIALTTLADWYV
jgi:hypothetical protein